MNNRPTTVYKDLDYLIIGQGLAGTLLSWFLLSENQRIKVIDFPRTNSASNVAAGIMNPVTGRRFVKSWRIEELLPFAKDSYRAIEDFLNISILQERNILRAIFSQKEENDWLIRTGEPGYQKYFREEAVLGKFEGKITEGFSFCELQQSAQVHVPLLVQSFKSYLQKENLIIEEKFDYQKVMQAEDGITYKALRTKKIVFCEGHQGHQNPWFTHLPFNESKGEVLLVRIPEVNFVRMLKHKLFIVPLQDDLYWVGSFYKWDFEDDEPTASGRQELEAKLKDILRVPFEIVNHRAAIRPTVKDRRPFLGLHPQFPALGIFNGLGTKGASLGPFFAKEMVDFLIHQKDIGQDVNITRFNKSA